jgi:general secretion pathway protein G
MSVENSEVPVPVSLWGRMESCGRLAIGLPVRCTSLQEGRLPIGLQDSILPHKYKHKHGRSGMTLIELIVACTIMMLLTYMAVPMARNRVRREKERDLRAALLQIRTAIDQYKDHADRNEFGPIKVGTEGYPETLEILVEGVKIANQVDKKVKFLRKIPLDPMTNARDWGKRSMQDDPKSTAWGGQNVFDVYTNSFDKARDGTPYSEW